MSEYYAKPTSPKPEHATLGINSTYDHHDAPQVLSDPNGTNGLHSLPGHGESDTTKYVHHAEEGGRNGVNGNSRHGGRASGRTICGVGMKIFVIVIIAIICAIAAAIGGGVGGSMAVRKCEREVQVLRAEAVSLSLSPSPTTTGGSSGSRTSTGIAGPTVSAEPGAGENIGSISVPKSKCPEVNGTLYTYSFGRASSVTFRRVCNTVMDGADMIQISTPSWSSCMDACAQYTDFFATLETKGATPNCAGISYVPEWSLFPQWAFGNYSTRGSCWLKSRMDGLRIGGGWSLPAEVVSSLRVD